MTPGIDVDRLADAVNRAAAVLAVDGRIAGPAAPQEHVADLLPAGPVVGTAASLSDGTVIVALASTAAALDPSLLGQAVTDAAATLGATVVATDAVDETGLASLVPHTAALIGAGLFAGDAVAASVGALVPGASPTVPAPTTTDVSATAATAGLPNLRLLADVELAVTAELGRTSMTMGNLLDLSPGSVIELDRTVGSPIDVLVNGALIARGEVIVIDEHYAIRVTEIVADRGD